MSGDKATGLKTSRRLQEAVLKVVEHELLIESSASELEAIPSTKGHTIEP
jgi:hypothetical protein